MAIAMLGEPITAKEALDMGMIYKTTESVQLMDKALKVAFKLASGPTYVNVFKSVFYYQLTLSSSIIPHLTHHRQAFLQVRRMVDLEYSFNETLEEERATQSYLGETEDFRSGVIAFFKKSKDGPKFNGQPPKNRAKL